LKSLDIPKERREIMMNRKALWMVLSMLLLVAQTAWVRDKVKRISIKQLYRLDNFYMQLSRDRKPTSVNKKDANLGKTYENLQKEYNESQRILREKEEKKGLARAMQGVGGGDVYTAAEKVTYNWVNIFLEERAAPLSKIENKLKTGLVSFQSQEAGAAAAPASGTPANGTKAGSAVTPAKAPRRPASFNVGFEQTQAYAYGLQVTYRNLTKRSDIQLEFGEQIKSVLTYQVQDQALTWSLSAGF
jgi:hypothetical protein